MKLNERVHNAVIDMVDYVIVSPINTLLVAPAYYGFNIAEDAKLSNQKKWNNLKINNSQITWKVKDGDNIAKRIAKRIINIIPTVLQAIPELALKGLQLPAFIVALVFRMVFEIAKVLVAPIVTVGSNAYNAIFSKKDANSAKKDDTNSAKIDEVGDSSESNFTMVESKDDNEASLDEDTTPLVKNTMFGRAKDAAEDYVEAWKYPVVASA